jgi:hypothetical protein
MYGKTYLQRHALSGVMADNWAHVDTVFLFKMTHIITSCSLANLTRTIPIKDAEFSYSIILSICKSDRHEYSIIPF